jgi:hypothetical protein
MVVLERWREVERPLADVADEVTAESLRADATLLRDEYQRLVTAAIKAGRPVRDPFPDVAGR